jgi:cytochrome b561
LDATRQTGIARERHNGVAIFLHWGTAILVLFQFISAEFWDFFPHPQKHLLIISHMSLGILLTALLLARIIWRLTPGHRVRPTETGIEALAAKAMHLGLYVLLAAQMLLGFLTRWTDNHPLNFFGLLLPSPLGHCSKATGNFVDQIHDINAWTIMVLASGHALMALFHHFIRRDGVLRRMLPVSAG